jgi:hypothetical protein
MFDFEKTKEVLGSRYNLNEVYQTVGNLITVVV